MIFKFRPGKTRIGTETGGSENRTNITTSNLNGAEYLSKIISGTIMQGGRLLTGHSKDRGPVNNVAQDTYLMPFRLGQGRAFKDAGYDRDYRSEKKRDYGLVQKAVGNENIPIYSRVNNPEKREELIQIYNPESTYKPNIKLVNPSLLSTLPVLISSSNLDNLLKYLILSSLLIYTPLATLTRYG